MDRDNQDDKNKGCHEGLLENEKCYKRKHIEESCSELHRKRSRESSHDDGVEMSSVVVSDDFVVRAEEEGLNLSSKKQGDLREMLKWLTLVARSPHDPSFGVVPHCSEWEEYTGKECCIQVIRAKDALRVQGDNVEFRYLKSLFQDQQRQAYSYANTKLRGSVAVGCDYQAKVDEWTESGLESDTKWLGTRIWPLENNEDLNHTLENDLIGKGRPDSCSCDTLLLGSVECIRFHIAEKRMELKHDLGNVFFHWRFHQMGEEVSLRWTEKEEKRFKDMMILDPQSFWEKAARRFRQKKREELVSYYFNVFLINRRRYQNRVTPGHIDSDVDEPFGVVGNSFGRDAVTLSSSDIMICSENRQREDSD